MAVTAVVVNVKDKFVAPAGTVMEAGTVALGSLLVSVTTAPPDGAGPVRVTEFIPVTCWPPTTVTGYSVRAEIVSGTTVKVPVLVTPP